MTHEEAARILNPETSLEALCEIEYYGGFRGEEACLEACNEARRIAAKVLREPPATQRGAARDDAAGTGLSIFRVCPNCGKPVAYNSYFQSWLCECGYKFVQDAAWISVKDRLPEKDGMYFVYAPGYRGNSRIYGLDGMAHSIFKNGCKGHWGIERGGSGRSGMVTHWMPLPEPPKGEEEYDGLHQNSGGIMS